LALARDYVTIVHDVIRVKSVRSHNGPMNILSGSFDQRDRSPISTVSEGLRTARAKKP
jgi:hypothetical protein